MTITIEVQNAQVAAAVPAETPDYGTVAKMVKATITSPSAMIQGVSRLVKQAGADTTLQNARRDRAQFAWIPHGDTCAFCLMLASNGWRNQSQNAMKNGHVSHIHSNCDCTYAVRFDSRTTVAGYDPDRYLEQYRAANGDLNAMRRADYQANKDIINAQKRRAYASRKGLELRAARGDVTSEYLKSAKPGIGNITLDKGYTESKHREEIKIAQWLHDTIGGDIVLLCETNEDKVKTPDYLWNEKMWDLKTISSEKAANSAVRHGIAQIRENPGGIILDFGDREFSLSALLDVIDRRMGWYDTNGSVDILVLSKGKLISAKRY